MMRLPRGQRRAELDAERAVNEAYRRRVLERIKNQNRLTGKGVGRPQNQQFTETSVRAHQSTSREVSPLVGRVALGGNENDLKDLRDGFYIAELEDTGGDPAVVSWAADVASLFYLGRAANDRAADDVVARRTFSHRGLDLRGYSDSYDAAGTGPEVFRHSADPEVVIPVAPGRLKRSDRARRSARKSESERTDSAGGQKDNGDETHSAALDAERGDEPTLRAEEIVREAISQPRTGHLSSVLSTLQPDQYRFVTAAEADTLVVDGAPGTGKTIIATHRLAFLTSRDREAPPVGRAALLGPTDRYSRHVATAFRELHADTVTVLSVPKLMGQVAGIDHRVMIDEPPSEMDSSTAVWSAIEVMLSRFKPQSRSVSRQVQELVDELTSDRNVDRAAAIGVPGMSEWLSSVGSFAEARKRRRHLPFLAACGLQLAGNSAPQTFDHLAVDEAQDISALEWLVLRRHLAAGGSWSLFGDLNQRRSRWTAGTWEQVGRHAGVEDEHLDVRRLTIGYRSTNAILRYANNLLPESERRESALVNGTSPIVSRCKRAAVSSTAARHAEEMAERFADGLVGVIALEARPIADELRRAGWRVARGGAELERDGQRIEVLTPAAARGLEYDGVVVVEPSDFPEDGRHAALYTSLTRATKDLGVVYSKALPIPLKGRLRHERRGLFGRLRRS